MIRVGRDIDEHVTVKCDVCIIGSGAGGGTAAMVLAQAGFDVVILEAGGHYTRERFTMHEQDVYPLLYQEGMRRATDDRAISLLQGRAVGGGTVVNWTTALRTPPEVIERWREFHGLVDIAGNTLTPHFEAMEARLGIHDVTREDINPNNAVLADGCEKLGWKYSLLRRNTRGCYRSGYCGLGCPVDAKQSMALTGLQDALDAGATLFSDCRVWRVIEAAGQVKRVEGYFHHPERGDAPTGGRISVEPEICILSGGALNSPALLMRSGIGDQSGMVGKRTFLHPAVAVQGWHEQPIEPYYGIPQTVMCHNFSQRGISRISYFIEAAPLHPAMYAAALPSFGSFHREAMSRLSHTNAMIAMMVDGFHEDEDGGEVSLRDDGSPSLSYDYTDLLWDAVAGAVRNLARICLAGGAKIVYTGHESPIRVTGEVDIPKIEVADYGPNIVRMFSAHQMGGCAMGGSPKESVVNADLRHHHIRNLYVMDGSVFPTGLGVNPQLSIYGLVHRAASRLAANGRSTQNG